jgi:hypothetical protein
MLGVGLGRTGVCECAHRIPRPGPHRAGQILVEDLFGGRAFEIGAVACEQLERRRAVLTSSPSSSSAADARAQAICNDASVCSESTATVSSSFWTSSVISIFKLTGSNPCVGPSVFASKVVVFHPTTEVVSGPGGSVST